MFRLALLFGVALFLIDAAALGNIGAILGSIIDPANMIETGSGSSSSGSSSTPSAPAPRGASGGF